MKTRFYLMLLLVLTALFAQAQTKSDCTSFHDGKFKIVNEKNDQVYIIERKGNTQIEWVEGTNSKMMLKVTWLDDCTYELRFKKYLSKSEDEPATDKKMVLRIEMFDLKENGYRQRTITKQHGIVAESEMIRIE